MFTGKKTQHVFFGFFFHLILMTGHGSHFWNMSEVSFKGSLELGISKPQTTYRESKAVLS